MTKNFKILCPFCSKPYTAEMLVELDSTIIGCETCAMPNAEAMIEIKCSHCKKVVYRKHVE